MENFKKTGTTIVGLKYKDGVILASDTRSTSGPEVADKNCSKIHTITPNIRCGGSGTAADTDRVTRMASKNLTLFYRKYGRIPRIHHCVRILRNHLHSYGGHIGAALVVGGVDDLGIHLYGVHPGGYHSSEMYTSLGSGSLAAIGILENGFRLDMEREEGIELACSAVKAGILNDLYSGSNIDVCVITRNELTVYKTEYFRNFMKIEEREKDERIRYPLDSIRVTKEEVFEILEEVKE
jgi:20S proteasome subunit beta 2